MSDSVETKLFWRAMIEHYWRPPSGKDGKRHVPWKFHGIFHMQFRGV